MGIGLSEYRAIIGAFAGTAASAGLRWRSKSRHRKSNRAKAVEEPEICESVKSSKSGNQRRRGRSLDGCNFNDRCKYPKRSSESLDRGTQGYKIYHQFAFRTRSQSKIPRQNNKEEEIKRKFKNSCTVCKTELFHIKMQRGRSPNGKTQECKCTHPQIMCSKNVEGKVNNSTHLHFFTCAAVFESLVLEQAIFSVVQMLLRRAGIETNPGPPAPPSSSCCNAGQHFNQVKNTIDRARGSFKSKVDQHTLTRKAVEIEETGQICIPLSFLIYSIGLEKALFQVA